MIKLDFKRLTKIIEKMLKNLQNDTSILLYILWENFTWNLYN